MPQIEILLAGILKLLAGLDPSKAAGLDAIKPIVLRSLKDQVAPILQAIFQHSLHTGQIWLEEGYRQTTLQKRRQVRPRQL